MADFTVYRDGGDGKFILHAETDAAQRWFDWNTMDESALKGKTIEVDHRHIAAMVEFIRQDGLTVEYTATS
jgi:glycine cleavage system aminomethyltransferase T